MLKNGLDSNPWDEEGSNELLSIPTFSCFSQIFQARAVVCST